MILQHRPPLHLTYCLNIHPGESWAENFAAIQEKALAVKNSVAADQWFGLGLRLSQTAAAQLAADPDLIEEARSFFADQQLYPFSVNAFPFGSFHGTTVKESVYHPDWRTQERLQYTLQVADVFSHFLPTEVDGSISTVPGSFKPWIQSDADRSLIAKNLGTAVAYLAALREDTGQEIHLGIEPEPDCLLETTEETVEFYKNFCLADGCAEIVRILGCSESQAEEMLRRHLGVCFDTCHVALQFENLADAYRTYVSEGIRISKVQLSAALKGRCAPATLDALRPFAEPTYLHQTKVQTETGAFISWYDLPHALQEIPSFPTAKELRVHFHVPLFLNSAGALESTASELTPDFFNELRKGHCSHLEIETYTFGVLPADLATESVSQSIAREYHWVLGRLE